MRLRNTDSICWSRCLHLYHIQNECMKLPEPMEHISYGPDERQGLNIMRCAQRGRDDTILVFIHGGAWMQGDRHMHNFVANGMHPHNISVITLGYRLAYKGSGLDHCVDDVIQGIQTVQKSFPKSNLLLAGHSAGGHLVMTALPRLPTMQGIRKVFCISGIYSLQEIVNTSVGVHVNFSRDQVHYIEISFERFNILFD
ncbi:putative arylformamidase-like [Tropilaelaps mercedesae]|uniref:Putative arylformamidase-like n=1 Tax=Tropilaelaps mercedesae TaxID=418985 RepID=A0A1V9X842_9ACAR|nr:putative arylformamidase-like [Tropilaelaps mercedesae]